jgi:superfamily II DNA/RNA helicase
VGTPEFISEAVQVGRLSAQAVSMVVIDEVDQCFKDDLDDMHGFLSRLLSSSFRAKTQPEDDSNEELVRLLAHKQTRARTRQTLCRTFTGSRQIVMSSAFIPHV